MRHDAGVTLGELIVLVLLIAILALVVGTPTHTHCGRASNERNAFTSLKTLASAEFDFRINDRDGNGVNDFWTADVKGLYTLTSAATVGATPNSTTDPSIRLIELSVAAADADGTFYPAAGENVALSNFAIASAKAGYWYAALKSDRSTVPATSMGPVYHPAKFGFSAFPDTQSAGKYVFMMNENNAVMRAAVTGSCRTGLSNPPGLGGVVPVYLHWPNDATLKSTWSKLD